MHSRRQNVASKQALLPRPPRRRKPKFKGTHFLGGASNAACTLVCMAQSDEHLQSTVRRSTVCQSTEYSVRTPKHAMYPVRMLSLYMTSKPPKKKTRETRGEKISSFCSPLVSEPDATAYTRQHYARRSGIPSYCSLAYTHHDNMRPTHPPTPLASTLQMLCTAVAPSLPSSTTPNSVLRAKLVLVD
ncbi:hypothetical protein CDD82_5362 [Ophiocordyceps australis]|uniref:Uncharacterized protein n=1 Tax=Ophiocordyceps australis TaxID=1399860 RepID=A0A2C5ZRK8_9HYPO|nr:hypothetical protein CDD82_5362 [Ophiocordyceps australis]